MRAVSLTSAKSGIQRLRDKAGARPDTLYDLENAYVTSALSVVPRPGTEVDYVLPAGTVGLTGFRGKKYVYASSTVTLDDPTYQLVVLNHPTIPGLELVYIHFAEPFLGFLYVVGEFANGDVFHYWLQEAATWEPNKMYREGELVQPTVPNGLAYIATRPGPPNPLWEPFAERSVGDVVEPTVANGYKFTVQSIEGSGDTGTGGGGGPPTPPDIPFPPLENADFELGDVDWTAASTNTATFDIIEDPYYAYEGYWVGRLVGDMADTNPQFVFNDLRAVQLGNGVGEFRVRFEDIGSLVGRTVEVRVCVQVVDGSDNVLRETTGTAITTNTQIGGDYFVWAPANVIALVTPGGTETIRVGVRVRSTVPGATGTYTLYIDNANFTYGI